MNTQYTLSTKAIEAIERWDAADKAVDELADKLRLAQNELRIAARQLGVWLTPADAAFGHITTTPIGDGFLCVRAEDDSEYTAFWRIRPSEPKPPERAPRPVVTEEPAKVRLTEDYDHISDLGVFFSSGTILWRQSTGQYAPPKGLLGEPCVHSYDAIREISVPVG